MARRRSGGVSAPLAIGAGLAVAAWTLGPRALVMSDIYLSPHFRLSELTTTSTGISNIPSWSHVVALRNLAVGTLEPIREILGVPIRITSGYRTPQVNEAVGGVRTSQHLTGEAADFIAVGLPSPVAMLRLADAVRSGRLRVGQLILYPPNRGGHIHVGAGTRGQLLEYPPDGPAVPYSSDVGPR